VDEETLSFARDFQRFMRQMSEASFADATSPFRELLQEHLGVDPRSLPVLSSGFPPYDHINVQVAMSAYQAEPPRSTRLIGLTGQQRHFATLSDLIETAHYTGIAVGAPDLVELPVGPQETLSCVQFGIHLIADGSDPFVVLMRGPTDHSPQQGVSLEVLAPNEQKGKTFLTDIRRLMIELNVFRGQVLSFGESPMGHIGVGPVTFIPRPNLARDELVLPDGILETVELHALGIAEHRDRLLASGQHVKRGLLLHGPPGTGKTLTVRYVMGRAQTHTVVLLAGGALHMIRVATGLARMLQPALVVMEDVDLVAEHRGMGPFGNPVLFDVLNELDGLAEDADVAFILTTNRADRLEPALASRPGRVDLAVEIPLPAEDERRRLIALYSRGLDLDVADLGRVIEQTAETPASFIKELLRKAALRAANARQGVGRITVTDEDLHRALDELLSERNTLTRALLGGEQTRGPLGPDGLFSQF